MIMFLRSFVEMVIVDPEDLDYAETRAIGWTLLVLATAAVEIETDDLLQ